MTILEFCNKLRWIIRASIHQWCVLYDQWSKNLWFLETPLPPVLLVLDTGTCFIFYTMTKSSSFSSETLCNKKKKSLRGITGIWYLDTSQYAWQNTEGGLKKLTYYKFLFTCYATPSTQRIRRLPRREDQRTPSAALGGFPRKAHLLASASSRMHPMLSNTRTRATQKFSPISFFPRNTNFTIFVMWMVSTTGKLDTTLPLGSQTTSPLARWNAKSHKHHHED